ncbi:MAG TPA: ferritin-like domain-containing protein [Pyrinomonadaceae bacterium]|jgi:rubrerythrin|nr:ferritin-like domain-containing protein [Pyrinomonadaceae bacterium]
MQNQSEQKLINLLQQAYSAEMAAAYAYNGHWKSVSNPDEQVHIKQIEDEEWHHRQLAGEMLTRLNSGPRRLKEIRATVLGRVLSILCHVCGWLAPMYGAGRLESRNIREYETAARYAHESGHQDFVDCLLGMAEVEWEHEFYFRSRVQSHRWGSKLQLWTAPPPKKAIRDSFNLLVAGAGEAPLAEATS